MNDRQCTLIDDAVESIVRCIEKSPSSDSKFDKAHPNPSTSFCSYRVFNVSNNNTVSLIDFLELLENALGKKAIIHYKDMQPGDVKDTLCSYERLKEETGWEPKVSFDEGLIYTLLYWDL